MTVVTVSSEAVADVDTADVDSFGASDAAAPRGTRHARALAALRSAEVRTGVRKQATAARAVETVRMEQPREHLHEQPREHLHEVPDKPTPEQPTGPSRVQVRALPGGLAAGPTALPAPSSGSRTGGPGEDARVLPVHPRLAALLPDDGLRTGTTVVVRGSTSLLLTLLAEASRDGAWTVLVGYPAAGMAAAADAGCDLARTLVVPLPAGSGVDAAAVLAALIDGMDVVVVGPEVALLDQDRRRLTSRARDRETVLIAAQPTPSSSQQDGWGAHVVLEATGGAWDGVDRGTGWLRRRTLRVRRTGRGSASRPLHLDVEVPVCRTAGEAAEQSSVVGDPGAPDGTSDGRPQLELVG
ncbi:hypothetical protein ACFT2C_15655 [Promicromonospora sp. NPDC057138]|uniref:hypothetical protein n=1 Tax=Promicromonospora sp. NPDC057138 TaxID=3346031 RepID=UPI003636CAEF